MAYTRNIQWIILSLWIYHAWSKSLVMVKHYCDYEDTNIHHAEVTGYAMCKMKDAANCQEQLPSALWKKIGSCWQKYQEEKSCEFEFPFTDNQYCCSKMSDCISDTEFDVFGEIDKICEETEDGVGPDCEIAENKSGRVMIKNNINNNGGEVPDNKTATGATLAFAATALIICALFAFAVSSIVKARNDGSSSKSKQRPRKESLRRLSLQYQGHQQLPLPTVYTSARPYPGRQKFPNGHTLSIIVEEDDVMSYSNSLISGQIEDEEETSSRLFEMDSTEDEDGEAAFNQSLTSGAAIQIYQRKNSSATEAALDYMDDVIDDVMMQIEIEDIDSVLDEDENMLSSAEKTPSDYSDQWSPRETVVCDVHRSPHPDHFPVQPATLLEDQSVLSGSALSIASAEQLEYRKSSTRKSDSGRSYKEEDNTDYYESENSPLSGLSEPRLIAKRESDVSISMFDISQLKSDDMRRGSDVRFCSTPDLAVATLAVPDIDDVLASDDDLLNNYESFT